MAALTASWPFFLRLDALHSEGILPRSWARAAVMMDGMKSSYLREVVLGGVEGRLEHVIRVVVQRDGLEDLQEGFVLTEFRILPIIGLAG